MHVLPEKSRFSRCGGVIHRGKSTGRRSNVAVRSRLGYVGGTRHQSGDGDTMDRAQLIDMFTKTASEVAEREFSNLTEATVIADMGVDSLAMLEAVGEMERELGIQIPDDNLVGIETIAQLLDVVEKRIQAA